MAELKSLAVFTAAAVLVLATPAHAQEGASGSGFQPYVFAAPGGISNGGTTFHLGGGTDMPLWKGFGASFEGGYLGPVESMDYGVGVVSTNAYWQFGTPARRRVTPFVTGGYSLAFRSETFNAINIGGGVNYWLSNTKGLRFELRDHMPFWGGDVADEHLWGIRIGFTWRR